MRLVNSIAKAVSFGKTLAAMALSAIVVLNGANIMVRYAMNSSIVWAEEVMMYLLSLAVFLGLGVLTLSGRHIVMDLLVNALPSGLRRLADIVALLCLLAVSIYIIWAGVPVVLLFYQYGQVSEAAHIPVAIPHAIVPLGFAIAAVAAVVRIHQILKSGPELGPAVEHFSTEVGHDDV